LTPAAGKDGASRARLPAAVLAGAAAAVLIASLALLGRHGLFDPDEPRYAGAAREMLHSGELVVPRFNGEVRLQKPILPYWSILVAYHLLGEGELAARLPSAVAFTMTILITAWLAARMHGPRVGAMAALVLAASPLPLAVSRLATPDAMLSLAITAALAAFAHGYGGAEERGRGAWSLVFFVALALGFLVKGPVAVVVPFLVVLLFLGWRREPGFLRRTRPLRGGLLFAAIALPWYVVVALRPELDGPALFLRETIGRYFGGEDFHGEPLWFFLPVVFLGFFPFVLYVAPGLRPGSGAGAAGAAGAVRAVRAAGRLRSFLPIWVAVVLVFFSLSPNKLATYVVPMSAPLAILAAAGIESIRGTARERRFAGVEAGALFLGVAAAVLWIVRNRPGALAPVLPVLAIALAWALGLALVASGRLPLRLADARGPVFAAVAIAGMVFLVPLIEAERSYRVLGELLAPRIEDEDLLVEGWFHQPGLVYYSEHRVVRLDRVEDIVANFRAARRMYALLDEEEFVRVASVLGGAPPVLHRQWGRVLFTNDRGVAGGAPSREPGE